MDTDSFTVLVKTVDICKDTAKDIETRFDNSNFEIDRPFSKGENKKVIGAMKDELGGKIMTKFVGLTAKTYSYLIDDDSDKRHQKVCHEKENQI